MLDALSSLFGVGKLCIVCTEIYTKMEDWLSPFFASMCNHTRGYVLIQMINSAHFFVQSFFCLMYRFVFAVGFNQYFDDTTITTLSFFHITKAILALSSITTSADRLSSFFISFTVFNSTFSTLFNQTAPVAAISFSIKERSN